MLQQIMSRKSGDAALATYLRLSWDKVLSQLSESSLPAFAHHLLAPAMQRMGLPFFVATLGDILQEELPVLPAADMTYLDTCWSNLGMDTLLPVSQASTALRSSIIFKVDSAELAV